MSASRGITSFQNPDVKRLAAWRRKRDRERAGVMIVEGYDELLMALRSKAVPRRLYRCPALRLSIDAEKVLAGLPADTEIITLSKPVFEKVSYRQSPDGWLGIFPALDTSLSSLKISPSPLILICEGIEKPGNLGAMLRTADAAGVDAVIAVGTRSDWGNPNIVRASRGAVFTVPVAEASLEELLDWLRSHGIRLYAATAEAQRDYADVSYRGGLAIAVGAEHHGLTPALRTYAEQEIRIPMYGRVNSLNVSVSAAILLYRAVTSR